MPVAAMVGSVAAMVALEAAVAVAAKGATCVRHR
jgi:hypothetical protein